MDIQAAWYACCVERTVGLGWKRNALSASGRIDATLGISCLTIELKREFSEEEAAMASNSLFGSDGRMETCPHNQKRSTLPHPAFAPSEATPSSLSLFGRPCM